MRAVLLHDPTPIAPFDRPASACVLFTRTLRDELARNLRAVGVRTVEDASLDAEVSGPALVVVDNTWVTQRAFRGFIAATQSETRPSVFALPPSRLLDLYAPLQDLVHDAKGNAAYDVYRVPAGHTMTLSALRALPESHWADPRYREVNLPLRVPHHMMGHDAPTFDTPVTSAVALKVRHWVTALRAGMLFPQVALIEAITQNPVHTMWNALRSVRAGKRQSVEAFRRNYRRVGKRSFVHPRAVVESCLIGDDVVVGPMAVLIGSVVGDGCVIEERAEVAYSVLGPRTFVSKSSVLSSCVTFGDTDACTNGIQTSIIAERCGLTSFAKVYDMNPRGLPVRVVDGDTLVSTGVLPCGAAFGAGCFVGAEARIAPGRVLPAETVLLGPHDTLLQRPIAPEATGTGRVESGRFVRLPVG